MYMTIKTFDCNLGFSISHILISRKVDMHDTNYIHVEKNNNSET